MSDVQYLIVPSNARQAIERLHPVYGTELEDGRVIAKVRAKSLPDGLPADVEVLGDDPVDIRRKLFEPPERGGVERLRAKVTTLDFQEVDKGGKQ